LSVPVCGLKASPVGLSGPEVSTAAPAERSFAQVRDAVLQDFKKDATARVESANLQYLKSKADIQLAPEFRQ